VIEPTTVAPPDHAELCQFTINNLVIGESVHFSLHSAVVADSERQVIQAIATLINARSDILVVVVIGHAAASTTWEASYALAMQRAEAVWRLLVEAGVHPDRVAFAARGAADGAGDVVRFDLIDALEPSWFRDSDQPRNPVLPWTGEPLQWHEPGQVTPAEPPAVDEFGLPER
jgi:hypothetical protein